ncbi:MAG: bifunctional folylpolyglutamate synthase/dihydrofolate synthase [Chloroflexota bacterium]|nr:bifunctional folylpolyglutamate synthase/dihydrofolate synthase [Chloroflexota bacterium]MDE2884686.1 bifunctional folylpolyglutamate synthase/dihydrofolate synthase [Chloroflexota bacterium]
MPAHYPEHASDTPYEAALHRLLSLVDLERMRGTVTPAYKYDLERMRELAGRLGLLDGGAPVIHVAGTKGKGSVAAMTASVLREHGLRTGLYTSPHLHSFRERIRLNGEPLGEDSFAAAVSRIWPVVENMANEPIGAPSTFEALTAMALDVFREERTDAVVLEVGLGGRLDATNVATSSVAVITSISLDHTAILGSTVAEIAGEKAGIVKGTHPVVSAPQDPSAMAVIRERALAMNAPLTTVGSDLTYVQEEHDLSGQTVSIATARDRYRIRLPLLGAHQAENTAVAVAALEQAPLSLTRDAIESGLATVRWDGRFQLLSSAPYLVVDGAHNPYSMARLRETVGEYLPGVRVHLVFGASGDKQIDLLVQEAAAFADEVWTVASRHPRAAHQDMLASAFARLGTSSRSAGSVAEGIERAMKAAGADDLVLITGSLFAVAEAIQHSLGIDGEHYPEFDPQASALGRV